MKTEHNYPMPPARPFKKCPQCAVPYAGGETMCYSCAQTNKGMTPAAMQMPMELPMGGKKNNPKDKNSSHGY